MHNESQSVPLGPAIADGLRNANGVPLISLSVEDASAATGISRSKIYQLIKGEKLTARKAGGRTLIETAELCRIVRDFPAIGRQPESAA